MNVKREFEEQLSKNANNNEPVFEKDDKPKGKQLKADSKGKKKEKKGGCC